MYLVEVLNGGFKPFLFGCSDTELLASAWWELTSDAMTASRQLSLKLPNKHECQPHRSRLEKNLYDPDQHQTDSSWAFMQKH